MDDAAIEMAEWERGHWNPIKCMLVKISIRGAHMTQRCYPYVTGEYWLPLQVLR